MGAPHRHAHRRDAGGGDHGLRPRAPLLHRLHGGGSAPPALLRLSLALHLRHAGAGDGRQLPPALLRLGGRRPRILSADRLLVPQAVSQRRRHQGLHRQPRRRFRLRARHLRRLHRVQHPAIRHGVRLGPGPGRQDHGISGDAGRRADHDLPARCSSAPWASRRSSCCTPGCRTPWRARRRCRP